MFSSIGGVAERRYLLPRLAAAQLQMNEQITERLTLPPSEPPIPQIASQSPPASDLTRHSLSTAEISRDRADDHIGF